MLFELCFFAKEDPMAECRPRALITGASAGIGRAFAERLARDKYDLVLVARRRHRLEAVAEQLRADVEVDVLAADLSQPTGLAEVETRLTKDASIFLLVNNAGFGAYKRFMELEPERADELIRLQVLAPTRLIRAVLPGMVRRKSGGVINIASLLALSGTLPANPVPFRATYAGAKSYLVTFTQALADELAGTGVKVQVCLPGLVSTEFHTIQGIDRTRMPPMMTPADLVAGSLAGLARGEVTCVPGLEDPALLERIGEAQRAVFMAAVKPSLAARYEREA
jgi:short-subunit dehydrogenase